MNARDDDKLTFPTRLSRRDVLRGGAVALGAALLPCGRAHASTANSARGKRNWSLIETARDNGNRLAASTMPEIALEKSLRVLQCDPDRRFQRMTGFGGALTESSAYVLAQLPPALRDDVLARYFDPHHGIGYTLARTHIGSCDFSLNMWTLANTPGDYELLDFSLAPMHRWLLPLLHDARRIAGADRLRLLASPWSPPAWMKTNNQMDDGGTLRPEYAPTWARHYVRYIQAMRAEKLPIWALTVQNEPEAEQRWESCIYTPEAERDFVRDHLGPALHAANLDGVQLFGWDHNRDFIERRADAMLGDPATAKYLAGMAVHWYVSDDYAAAQRVVDKYPGKQVIFTEGCVEGGAKPGEWAVGERYARNIIGDLSHGVSAWIDWNIALDLRGGPNHVGNFCDAPVLVDTHAKTVRYQSSFHYIGHFSRYVQPGARRISTDAIPDGLRAIAFVNPDGGIAAIVVNDGDTEHAFALAAGADQRGCRIPGHAIQTYLIPA